MAEIIYGIGEIGFTLFIGSKIIVKIAQVCGLNDLMALIGDAMIVGAGSFGNKGGNDVY